MREEIARVVYPVLTTGLRLKEELRAGVNLDFGHVQKELLGLLQSTAQVQALVNPNDLVRDFLGIQYPLACWLDEIFLMNDSPWQSAWENDILEFSLFETRHRAWKFWQQARLAMKLSEPDALEVIYLCVTLGFRGDLDCSDAPKGGDSQVDPLVRLQSWCADIRRQIDEARPPENLGLVEKQPRTYVPELNGDRRMRTILRVLIGTSLALVLFGSFLFFFQFRS